jgi:hypothetical protein
MITLNLAVTKGTGSLTSEINLIDSGYTAAKADSIMLRIENGVFPKIVRSTKNSTLTINSTGTLTIKLSETERNAVAASGWNAKLYKDNVLIAAGEVTNS